MVNANLRNFMTAILMGDIVSVNGRPAKGSVVVRSQVIMLVPSRRTAWPVWELDITCETGAFPGARGLLLVSPGLTLRNASMQDDRQPADQRGRVGTLGLLPDPNVPASS